MNRRIAKWLAGAAGASWMFSLLMGHGLAYALMMLGVPPTLH